MGLQAAEGKLISLAKAGMGDLEGTVTDKAAVTVRGYGMKKRDSGRGEGAVEKWMETV